MIEDGLAIESRATVIVVDPTATPQKVGKAFPNIDASRFRIIPHEPQLRHRVGGHHVDVTFLQLGPQVPPWA